MIFVYFCEFRGWATILETHVRMKTCLQCVCQHANMVQIFMLAAKRRRFAFWGCSGGDTVWASFRRHMGQRNSF